MTAFPNSKPQPSSFKSGLDFLDWVFGVPQRVPNVPAESDRKVNFDMPMAESTRPEASLPSSDELNLEEVDFDIDAEMAALFSGGASGHELAYPPELDRSDQSFVPPVKPVEISPDDPLSELAHLVGYSPTAAKRPEPLFDLEDELLREFERYDVPPAKE